jgi:D-alanyl-D-alanine carboxypeptidase/D-alanyl-D-alanine-endopeptidase (penicillin-binding protein 4)
LTLGAHRFQLALPAACLLVVCPLARPSPARADWKADVQRLAGSDGVVWVEDEAGARLLQYGGERSFVPASTLKVVTTLLAMDVLGTEHRFRTEFFLDGDRLIVRGGGDPFLVSEELDLVAHELAGPLNGRSLAGVFVDDSFFDAGVDVPGVGASEEPYDALNSATAVNFNTVNVRVVDGRIESAELQTPLTPLAEQVARRRGLRGELRVNLSNNPQDVRRYAAELIAAKLRAAGVPVGEAVGEASAPAAAAPLHVHENSRTLGEVCAQMLYYSNNYIANQVFLAVGAAAEGAPASLAKSVRVATRWIAEHPELAGISVTEGSGISYDNRATAAAMLAALRIFVPYKGLLREKNGTRHKTGTLTITKSVVGYLDTQSHGTVRYVISLDGGRSQARWDIIESIRRAL